MSAILKFDFQIRKQLCFSEVNYLNYTKRPKFACDNYIFPKARGNKNKQCTHSTPLKLIYKNTMIFFYKYTCNDDIVKHRIILIRMILFVIWLQTSSSSQKDERFCRSLLLFAHRHIAGATKRSWFLGNGKQSSKNVM